MKKFASVIALLFVVLAPAAVSQIMIVSPPEGATSAFTHQAVIGNALPSMSITLEVNGVVVDSAVTRVDGVFEFLGVRCQPGPVEFKATVRMKNGKQFSVTRSIHIFGEPDTLLIETESDELPADGSSQRAITVTVLDRWKKKIDSGYFITVEADSLQILGDDVDLNTQGHQVKLTDGQASFTVQATRYVGPVSLKISSNAVSAVHPMYAVTPSVPFMLVGSADGTVKSLTAQGNTSDFSSESDFSGGTKKRGRIAAMGRGSVFGDYLLTLSLDTDRKLQDRIFRDLDPNSLYSMYGDNSIVQYEAQSTSALFAKIEKNQSYVLYGDFNTQMTKNEFAAYNRSFTGGRLHAQTAGATVDAFGTLTNRKVVQEEIRGAGISGYYYLRQNNIVTGSEKVRIEVRDKFRSEIVITSKEKSRYTDYEIDYMQGSLYFKQPVPSLDDQGNPVYIVVAYEAITNSPDNLVAGGSAEVVLFDALTLGGMTVVERREPRDYKLFGGSADMNFGSGFKLKSEVARSADVNATGNAWKVEAEMAPGKWIGLRPYYRKVDGTFVNTTQSGSGREVGTEKYGTSVQISPFEKTAITGDYYTQRQTQGTFASDVRSLSGSIQQSLGNESDVGVKVEDVRYDGVNPESPSQNVKTHSTLLSSRARARVVDGLHATAEYEHNLVKSDKEVRPDAVGIGLEYMITKDLSLYAQQRFLQGQGQLTTVGVNTKVAEGTSVYGRYELGNAISGERNAATVGLKNSLKITDELTTNVLYEKTKNLGKRLAEARTDDHDALSVSFEYLPLFPLRASLKGEYGEDANNLRKGFDFGVSYRLFNDLSLVAKGTNYRAEARTQSGYTRQLEYLFGMAYRPTNVNWLNVISKLEHKVQDNQVVQPTNYYRSTIVSAHASVELSADIEIGMKYALKNSREIVGENSFSTISDFILCRPQYDLLQWMNIAGEVRVLRQRGANDMKIGYSGEAGFVFIKNTMLSFGYNFQGYKDRDLIDYVYSVSGPYVTLRMKFTEELFGLDSAR
ncbi:MAG: hypothetical protein HY961_12630 [Ignavibacteriae bacterium]|nr:hypothetical protein [Ignavibacteriota bacterium]